MRLICPNCGAQYEVDDSLVPDAGRDVQCSNCGHAWFQRPAHMDADLAAETGRTLDAPEAADEDEDAPKAPPRTPPAPDEDEDDEPIVAEPAPAARRTMDESVKSILSEEAEREAAARREEQGIETQGDLGLDDPPKSSALRERMARLRGLDVDERADSAAAAVAAATAAGSRRDLLPDIEEINSSLRSAEERDQDAAATTVTVETTRRSGFRTGFTLVVLLALVAVLVYVFADRIATAVPAAAPALTAYVEWADGMRVWLDGMAQVWIHKLTGSGQPG